jgi:hypothetical protein
MKKTAWMSLLAAVCIGVGLAGCGPSGECGSCSSNSDCNPGLTCQTFSTDSGKDYELCGNADPYETCTITEYY